VNTKYPKQTTRKCSRCGRNLLLIDEVTETMEGQYGPITTSTYICSDKDCQIEFDRDLVKILKNKEEKDKALVVRLEKLKMNRKKSKDKKTLSL
jgi:hypothetical protein